jgi:hypothetical protein
MQRSALLIALLTATAALSSACNSLGTCDEDARGRGLVVSGNQLMYTGQAIINQSCLPCHSSTATGAARKGAPAGLNFELFPIADATKTVTSNGTLVGLDLTSDAAHQEQLATLRSHQRKVYDNRELIWEQVDKGLMPPASASSFKSLTNIVRAMFGADTMCTRNMALKDLDTNREDFRNWLACDTPIIEASSALLPYKALPANASKADSAAGTGYYSVPGVSVGYQYPSCGGGSSGGGVSFDDVYNNVLSKPSNTCLACHAGTAPMGNFDIGTIDKAYTTLLGTGTGGMTTCAMSPVYVKPNDPANSYLLNMLVLAKTRCTPNVMPSGSPTGLNSADVDLITQWINMGAPRHAPASGGSDAGADAGADAGR